MVWMHMYPQNGSSNYLGSENNIPKYAPLDIAPGKQQT
jgi:hypothetical protein